jgi:hypothetical protein
MRQVFRRYLVCAVAAAVTAIGTVTAVATASGTEAADDQPSAVEDYNYPGADQILANYGVQLTSGDGHILFADCPVGPDTVGLIIVRTTDPAGPTSDGKICFHVLGPTGQLSMMIPAVYSIRGDGLTQGQGHKLKAELTTDAGIRTTVDVNPSGTTQVGITTTPPGDPTTLLQLNASS